MNDRYFLSRSNNFFVDKLISKNLRLTHASIGMTQHIKVFFRKVMLFQKRV